MKNLLYAICGFILLWSCNSGSDDMKEMSLKELRTELNEKKDKIRSLQTEVAKYEEAIENKDTTKASELLNVTIDTAHKQKFEHFVDIQGVVQSEDQVNASAEMGGNITSLLIEEGDDISRGALVAVLDVQSLQAQKEELENSLELAQDLFERQKRLWEKKVGTEVQYIQAKNQVESIKKSIKTLESNMAKSRVYAPQSGTVENLMVKQGEFVGPGAPIAMITSSDDLKVKAEVPERYLQNISKGQEITIRFPNLDMQQTSEISLIGSSINQANRTFKIEAPIEVDERNLIKPNLLAIIEIRDYVKDSTIVLAAPIVQQEVMGENYVLIAEKNDEDIYESKKVYVETGKHFDDQVLIDEGISVGDYIIQSGARGLSSGIKLNILSDAEAKTMVSKFTKG